MKKNTIKHSLLIAIFLVVASACSIEKRVHNKGYFVKWHSNSHLFQKDYLPEKEIDEVATKQQESIENIAIKEDLYQQKSEGLLSETMINEQQSMARNKFSITTQDNENTLTVLNTNKLDKTESADQKPLITKNNKSSYRADTELIINIVLTVLLLALLILFIYLAIPATGTMVYVWWGLAAVCAIFFVTQVLDLILW